MKVLITGGAGFIGSHIAELLIEKGIEIVIVDDLSNGDITNIPSSVRFYQVSINDVSMNDVFHIEQPTHIIHHAAQTKILHSIQKPIEDAMINIIGTINVLNLAVKYQCQKVIYASSAAVYGDTEHIPLHENIHASPISPYGISKFVPELYIKTFNRLHGLPYSILRYANVFGNRQSALLDGGVVPIFIEKAVNERPIIVFGDGNQTRDFIYVKDIAHANLNALHRGDNQTMNISSGRSISINELINHLAVVYKRYVRTIYQSERPGDIYHSSLDNTQARNILNWSPQYGLLEGLEDMVMILGKKERDQLLI